MPQLVPLVLTVGSETRTFAPTSNRNNKAILVDLTTHTRIADQEVISAEVTTATTTSGSRFKGVLKVPVPVEDQAGCCVDKDRPQAIYVNVDVVGSNTATATNRTEALELFRAWVASAAFADLFNGNAYY